MDSAHTPILDAATFTCRGTVYPWQRDPMGPMNVMWYVGKFDEAVWNPFARVGRTPGYLRTTGRGMETMFDAELGHVAASRDLVGVHLDTSERRAVSFPPTIAERLQADLRAAAPRP
jgi:acyl-CoA thioester hydrolase